MAAVIAGLPAPLAAQEQTELSPLEDEIRQWADADREGDPQAVFDALSGLEARVAARSDAVSLRSRGELYAMLGVALYAMQDIAAASQWFDRAEAAYQDAGNAPEKVAEIAANRAVILRRGNRLAEAEAAARQALSIRRELYGDVHGDVANSLNILGNVLYSRGYYEEALGLMREALAAQRAADPGNWLEIVKRLDSLGSLLDETGRDDEALRTAREAEAAARDHLGADHAWYGYAINTLGQVLLDMGQYGEAIPVIRQTLAFRATHLGEDHPYTAASLMVLSAALEETGKLEEAAALSEAGVAILVNHRDLIDPNTLAGFYRLRARIAASLGNWEAYDEITAQAGADLAMALDPQSPALAIFWINHAHQLHRRGSDAQALELAEQYVPLLQQTLIPSNTDRIFGEMLLARLRQASGAPMAGEWAWIDGVRDALVGKLSDIGATDREIAASAADNAAALVLYFETALASRQDARAFDALQLVTLSDLSLGLQRAGADDAGGDEAASAHRRVTRSASDLRLLQRRYSLALDSEDEAAISALAASIDSQRAAYESQVAALTGLYPEYVARYRPRPVALADLQARLAADDVLVIALEARGRGTIATLTRDGGIAWHSFDTGEMRRHVEGLRASLEGGPEAGDFPRGDALALYHMLLPGGVPEGGRLLLYGGQALASLPPAVLLTHASDAPLADAPWLVRRAAIQVVGNLALFGGGQDSGEDSGQGGAQDIPQGAQFVGVGGAQLPGQPLLPDGAQLAGLFRSGRPAIETIADLPPLPGAEAELRRMARALPGNSTMLLVGPDAAEEVFKRTDLGKARIIAFATHGLVAGELRGLWEPALLLGTSDPASGEDGLLGASEIARLDLHAEWVILSACNTAAGADGRAPVYSGLASAFAQAGARSLMLSHWRVRDDAAAFLSVQTVRRAAGGESRAGALRSAQLDMMARSDIPGAAHPAIWAPFVIVEN